MRIVRRKPGRTVTAREIAGRLGASRDQLRALVRRGELPLPTRLGRALVFDRTEAREAVARIMRRRAKAKSPGYPTSRPLPRWGGARAKVAPPITSVDVARVLEVGVQTVRQMARRGQIDGAWKADGQWFFDPDEVRWLCAHRHRERGQAGANLVPRLSKGGGQDVRPS